MQGSSDRIANSGTVASPTSALSPGGSALAPSAFCLQPSALLWGVRHRANAGGPIPNPSLIPAPLLILLVLVVLLLLPGCTSVPTRLEQKFFNIRTNQIPTVTLVTNIIPVYSDTNALPHSTPV